MVLIVVVIVIIILGSSCCVLCYSSMKLNRAELFQKQFLDQMNRVVPRVLNFSRFVRSVALQPPPPAASSSYVNLEMEFSQNPVAAVNPVPPAAPELLLHENLQIPENREQIQNNQNELEEDLHVRFRVIQPNSSSPLVIRWQEQFFVTQRRKWNSTGNLQDLQSNRRNALFKCKSLPHSVCQHA